MMNFSKQKIIVTNMEAIEIELECSLHLENQRLLDVFIHFV